MISKELEIDFQEISQYLKELNLGGCTIMITGATGLIASVLIKSIVLYNSISERKIYVIALARNPRKMEMVYEDYLNNDDFTTHVKFIYQDICEKISENIEVDYIIHTANSTNSKFFMSNPVEVIESIYTGTKNVLEFAKNGLVKGMTYLSSMEVFGQVYKDERVTEEELGYLDIQNVRSCYSEGKRLAECMCKSYAEEYDVPVKMARLAQTFGAGVSQNDNRVFAQFAKSAIQGENIVLHTKGASIGNYCYTTDAIRAILLLLVSGENGDVYTVVNEETTTTIFDMANMVASKFSNNKSQVIFDIPQDNLYGYAPETKLKLSSKKLNNLGWTAKVGLEEAYRRMLPGLK